MNNPQPQIVCFGEVLWDVFPDRSLLGGAPLNVAMRLQSLGANAHIISSVGMDELGKKALDKIQSSGMPVSTINQLDDLPTGTVAVKLKDGIPSYTIEEPVAWDHIVVNQTALDAIKSCDAIVFGSLAMRSDINLDSLKKLRSHSQKMVLDINLREPFYDDALIKELIEIADILKLNDEELIYASELFELNSTELEDQIRELSAVTNTASICVTLGSKGAILLYKDDFFTHPGYKVEVDDTVGAGDSFLAGLLFGIFSGNSPEDSLDLACALGALVASKSGANCKVSTEEINKLRS